MRCKTIYSFLAGAVIFSLSSNVKADAEQQAYRIHQRLAGVPPTAEILKTMTDLINQGKSFEAALIATEHKAFVNSSLKAWATSMSNVDGNKRAAFGDMAATMIGMIRDNVPFKEVLYGDILYYSPNTAISALSASNNDHYDTTRANVASIINRNLDLSLATNLQKGLQSTSYALPVAAVAGVMTTRTYGEEFFKAGTNRRALRFAFKNFLCHDFEQLHDTTRSGDFVRRDVDRAPAGNSKTFLSKCLGCHAGMDGFSGAVANYDFNASNRLLYTPALPAGVNLTTDDGPIVANRPVPKMARGATNFPSGYEVKDDKWRNYWVAGKNEKLGWRLPADANIVTDQEYWDGQGLKDFGKVLAHTKAFSRCMAQQVLSKTCFAPAHEARYSAMIEENANFFEEKNYNMKSLFAKTATQCAGE